ncbi:hypothetical protein L3X38_005363 [Prunus dulcis]|uniref:Uncharacterized protein n=1 Tax=Prunus dulcis TaxID=3755 RepID=A0AAD5F414_PRUDU|nr:hypothetical protein L3X38_005363 [Prunus dulcis]
MAVSKKRVNLSAIKSEGLVMASQITLAMFALCFALLVMLGSAADMPGMPGMGAATPVAPPSGSGFTCPSMAVAFFALVAAFVA